MLALFVAAITVSNANDGFWQTGGSEKPFGVEHTSIQMVREHAHFDIDDYDVSVRVEFVFTNYGEATTVKMAFPEEGSSNSPEHFQDFSSTVDGRIVPVKRIELRNDEDTYDAVWVKTVSFSKGQTRKVVNTYKQGVSGDIYGNLAFDYIFSTGASWFKTIDEIRVTYSYKPGKRLSYPYPVRFGGKEGFTPTAALAIGRSERKIVWRNVEPDFSLGLHMTPGFWKVEVNGLLVAPYAISSIPLGKPQDLLVQSGSVSGVFGEPNKKGLFYGDSWTEGTRIDWDGRGIDFRDSKSITVDGRRVSLRRPIRTLPIWKGNPHSPTSEYVYLRDVVEALGGTYRYDQKLDKVFINVPTK